MKIHSCSSNGKKLSLAAVLNIALYPGDFIAFTPGNDIETIMKVSDVNFVTGVVLFEEVGIYSEFTGVSIGSSTCFLKTMELEKSTARVIINQPELDQIRAFDIELLSQES